MKATPQGKSNLTATKRVRKLDVTSTQSLQRSTVGSTHGDRPCNIGTKKTAITNNVVSATRIKKGIINGYHGNKGSTLEIDHGTGHTRWERNRTREVKVITKFKIRNGGGYTKVRKHNLVIKDRGTLRR